MNSKSEFAAPDYDYTSPDTIIYYEQAVLGALLVAPRYMVDLEDILNGSEFSDATNKIIFSAIKKMSDESIPIDVITVAQFIENHGKGESSRVLPLLGTMASQVPAPANVVHYAQNLAARARAKGNAVVLAGLSVDMVSASTELITRPGVDIKDRINEIGQRLEEMKTDQERRVTFRHIGEAAQESLEEIEMCFSRDGAHSGLLTGFPDLDDQLNGLQGGDLIIVAGRPSMGKTAFAVNIGENMAMSGAVGVVISLEMPGKQLAARMFSSIGRLRSDDIRRGRLDEDGFGRLTLACSKVNQMKFYIDDRSVACVADIKAAARKVVAKEGKINFLIIDYLQLMNEVKGRGQDNRNDEIAEISRGLKALAKEFNIPVIALSQLNRSLEKRQDKRPMMSDLRESGALEQDADVILFIYRDEVYNPDTAEIGIAEIIIGKQRNGPVGTVLANFEKEYSKFSGRTVNY